MDNLYRTMVFDSHSISNFLELWLLTFLDLKSNIILSLLLLHRFAVKLMQKKRVYSILRMIGNYKEIYQVLIFLKSLKIFPVNSLCELPYMSRLWLVKSLLLLRASHSYLKQHELSKE